jgi:hypothetical protein
MRPLRLFARAAALTACLVVLASCGDGGTGPFNGDLFLRLRVNGTLYEFSLDGGLIATFGGSGRFNNLNISGTDAGATSALVQVWDTVMVSPRVYTKYTATVPAGAFGAIVSFTDASGTDYASGDPGTDANVTITEISSTQVAGTFSGILAATGQANVSVTEGSFRVARFN